MTADHGEFHGDHVGPDGDWPSPDHDWPSPDSDWAGLDRDRARPDSDRARPDSDWPDADRGWADPDDDWAGPDSDWTDPDGDWADPDDDHVCPDCQGETKRMLRLALPPDLPTVRLARQATRDTLAAWHLSHLEEAAVLLVSELVTNAVRHARDTGAIGLELATMGTGLRMEVQDGDPHWRLKPSSPDDDESGFGFVLVDCLAGRWGIRRVSAGKAVWVELDA
jgi:anti-sigma regulatory factor (Ser/Thr protein kinase)